VEILTDSYLALFFCNLASKCDQKTMEYSSRKCLVKSKQDPFFVTWGSTRGLGGNFGFFFS
jgi:hypothetical protein